jgi:hypothetical protein
MGRTQTTPAPAHELVDRPDEITHLVCCREVPWSTAFCGFQDLTGVNPSAVHFCSMCLEEAETRQPGWLGDGAPVCPLDGQPCPSEEEVDARIARETGGSG